MQLSVPEAEDANSAVAATAAAVGFRCMTLLRRPLSCCSGRHQQQDRGIWHTGGRERQSVQVLQVQLLVLCKESCASEAAVTAGKGGTASIIQVINFTELACDLVFAEELAQHLLGVIECVAIHHDAAVMCGR